MFKFPRVGEDSTKSHSLNSNVPVSQVCNILRALGVYPTEKEAMEIENEIRFSQFVESGRRVEEIDLDTLIQGTTSSIYILNCSVYVNHRSVFSVNKSMLREAFRALGADENGQIDTQSLLLSLQYKGISPISSLLNFLGEQLSDSDLGACLLDLLGTNGSGDFLSVLPPKLDAISFASKVLQFEDYEDDPDEEQKALAMHLRGTNAQKQQEQQLQQQSTTQPTIPRILSASSARSTSSAGSFSQKKGTLAQASRKSASSMASSASVTRPTMLDKPRGKLRVSKP